MSKQTFKKNERKAALEIKEVQHNHELSFVKAKTFSSLECFLNNQWFFF